ncbi:hypothetical protein GCM10017687_05750 [Streptomyces echinatus]
MWWTWCGCGPWCGATGTARPWPARCPGNCGRKRSGAGGQLEEAVAERHPAALEEFCDRETLSAATLTAALRDLTRSGDGVVVLCGSAYRNRGIEPLLDAVVAYLPSPLDVPAVRGVHGGAEQRRAADPEGPFAGLVFKVNATATGRLAYVRVYSGTVGKGDVVRDPGGGRTERVARILRVMADRHVQLDRRSRVTSSRSSA